MNKHIAFFMPNFKIGGVERAFVNLANSLAEDGYKVDFIVLQDEGQLKNELDKRISIISFQVSRLRGTFIKLVRFLKTTSADCLITGHTYLNIMALICNSLSFKRVRIIVSQHSYQDVEMKSFGLKGKLAPYLIKNTYNIANKVVAVSNSVREDLTVNYHVNPKNIVTIYNSVISDKFFAKSDEEIESHIKLKLGSKNYLVAVGRLEIVKNIPFLLEAYAQLRKNDLSFAYDLVILGDGTQMDNLKEIAIRLGLKENVHFLGAILNPLPIIKQAKLFVHTSYSEALPLVYIEALALKVPIVTINNSGAEEILQGVEPKLIISSHNQEEFINGIDIMLKKSINMNFPSLDQYKSEKIRDQYLHLIFS